jgi:hypothetical protein
MYQLDFEMSKRGINTSKSLVNIAVACTLPHSCIHRGLTSVQPVALGACLRANCWLTLAKIGLHPNHWSTSAVECTLPHSCIHWGLPSVQPVALGGCLRANCWLTLAKMGAQLLLMLSSQALLPGTGFALNTLWTESNLLRCFTRLTQTVRCQ